MNLKLPAILVTIAISLATGFYLGMNYPRPLPPNTYGDFEAQISRTIDGDTAVVLIHEEEEPVRYIGIDTPETKHPSKGAECFGRESAEKNKELIMGKSVRFERDKKNRDHRGRLLRYVWVDDKMVNLELVREGYAFSSHVSPNGKYRGLFEKAEAKARADNLGLWGMCKVLIGERLSAKVKQKKLPNLKID